MEYPTWMERPGGRRTRNLPLCAGSHRLGKACGGPRPISDLHGPTYTYGSDARLENAAMIMMKCPSSLPQPSPRTIRKPSVLPPLKGAHVPKEKIYDLGPCQVQFTSLLGPKGTGDPPNKKGKKRTPVPTPCGEENQRSPIKGKRRQDAHHLVLPAL